MWTRPHASATTSASTAARPASLRMDVDSDHLADATGESVASALPFA